MDAESKAFCDGENVIRPPSVGAWPPRAAGPQLLFVRPRGIEMNGRDERPFLRRRRILGVGALVFAVIAGGVWVARDRW